MKVLLNQDCYDFELSQKALKILINNYGWTVGDYDLIYKTRDEKTDIGYYQKDNYYSINCLKHNVDDIKFRTNQDIINVFEILHDDFTPHDIKMHERGIIKLVEIPNNIEWYINNDDNYESIHEKHRVWE